jgi:hypothetical protein
MKLNCLIKLNLFDQNIEINVKNFFFFISLLNDKI